MKITKKLLAIVMAIVMLASVCVIGASAKANVLDLAFVVDTTGSMSDDIYRVKNDMADYLQKLEEIGADYRIAIIDYRDFPERAASYDYPYRVALDFTNDSTTIINAINGLSLGNGGDTPETLYSALIDGLDELSWRSGSGKAAIVMGDAPALDPEPYTGYTLENVKNKLLYDNIGATGISGSTLASSVVGRAGSRSAITLFTIATSSSYSTIENFEALAEATNGKSYTAESSAEITEIIDTIIEELPETVAQPSFLDKIWAFFKKIFYILTFQWDKI